MIKNESSDQNIFEKSLSALIDILDKNKRKLLLSIVFGGVIGVGLSFLAQKKYTAKAELLPEFSIDKLGSLGSMASLAGMDISNSSESDAIRPDLYPNVLQSSPALFYLLRQPVTTDTGKIYPTLLSFYEVSNGVKIRRGFPSLKFTDSLYKYRPAELVIISSLKKSINSSFDKKSGIIAISVEMSDPRIAALTLENCIKYLREYTSEYRYNKTHTEAAFVTRQLKLVRERMLRTQYALQKFKDGNRNLFLNTAKIEEQKLEETYSVASSLHNDLTRELEKLNIAEHEKKPVFQILEPPVIPATKSSPNRLFYGMAGSAIMFVCTFAGLLILSKKLR